MHVSVNDPPFGIVTGAYTGEKVTCPQESKTGRSSLTLVSISWSELLML